MLGNTDEPPEGAGGNGSVDEEEEQQKSLMQVSSHDYIQASWHSVFSFW